MKTLSLSSKKGREEYEELYWNEDKDFYKEMEKSSFIDCIRDKKASFLTYKGRPVYIYNLNDYAGIFIIEIKGMFYNMFGQGVCEFKSAMGYLADSGVPFLSFKKDSIDLLAWRDKNGIVLNGDLSEDEEHEYLVEEKLPIISMNCLVEMFGLKSHLQVCELFVREEVYVEAHTLDVRKNLTQREKEQLHDFEMGVSKTKPQPPKRGFSLVRTFDEKYWHQAGTTLVSRKDVKSLIYESYLFGMDEDQYFGVQLPRFIKGTVEAAFNALVPQELQDRKCKFDRQGEWFVVPMKKIPEVAGRFVIGSHRKTSLAQLPLDDIDGNVHEIASEEIVVLDSEDGMKIYAWDGQLTHMEHETIKFGGWVEFIHNTALKSVSTEGVD